MRAWGITWRHAAVCAALAAVISVAAAQAPAPPPNGPRYAPNGDLLAPAGFQSWVFVGSNLGLAYKADLPAMTAAEAARAEKPVFHNIYLTPEGYAQFRANRTAFPEGTILVMEQFEAADKEPKDILSAGSYNGRKVGTEIAVKDSNRPHATPSAWAYYDFTDPADPTKLRPQARARPDVACANCHRDHAGPDNVWVRFYPVLRDLPPP